jgi:PEP-CTERM motif
LGTNPANAGTIHTGGAGDFEYGVSCNPPSAACGNGGSSPYTGTLTFDITASGLTLAKLEQNADGNYFSMDVLGTTGHTGVIDAHTFTPITPAPEPGTLALLGSTLAGFALLRRRKRA